MYNERYLLKTFMNFCRFNKYLDHMYYVTSKEKIHHKEEIKMNEELRQLVEANTNEINALKEQYKGISPLLHELNYEIFEIIDELDVENNKELFEHLIKVSRMADILEERLRGKNGEMIERHTIEYLFSKLESNISNGTFSAIFCKDDDKPVILVLKNTLGINPSEKEMPVDSKIKLLSLDIDKLPVMDLDGEVKRVQAEKEFEGLSQKEKIEKCMKKLFGVSDEELSTIQEQEDNQAPVTVYKVKKINKTNGMVVFEKEFDSRKSATEYVKQIVSDYPELTKQYNFEVELVTK